MKKIAFYLFWTLMCLHTSVSFSEAATGTLDDALAEIDSIIAESELTSESVASTTASGKELTLDSAPTQYMQPAQTTIQLTLTPWELIHRTAMMQGFTWGIPTANFVTPTMYIGTPVKTNMNSIGYNIYIGATNYSECVRAETDASFGIEGEMLEATIEDELRNIAKYCATEFYGSYFEGKAYTTREEMLLFIFTMFDEPVYMPGYFEEKSFVFTGDATDTAYSNVSREAWYAPYLSLAYDLIMVEDEGTWEVAQEVTDEDIQMMFEMYLTGEDGQLTDTVETNYGTYSIWYDELGLAIEKSTTASPQLTSAPEESTGDTGVTDISSEDEEDFIASLFELDETEITESVE